MVTPIPLLTTEQVAAKVQRSPATVNRWVNRGLLPVAAQAPGTRGARFYRAADVLDLMDSENEKSA